MTNEIYEARKQVRETGCFGEMPFRSLPYPVVTVKPNKQELKNTER
jgi:hypothetical protein